MIFSCFVYLYAQQTTSTNNRKCSSIQKYIHTWSKQKHARRDPYVSLYEFHLSVELSAKMRNEPCWICLVACTWHQVIFLYTSKIFSVGSAIYSFHSNPSTVFTLRYFLMIITMLQCVGNECGTMMRFL